MTEEKTKPIEKASADDMKSLRAQGLSNAQIAAALGCSRNLVHRKIGAQPVEVRQNRHVPGEKAERQKGTAVTMDSMLKLRVEGLSNTQIANTLGVSRQYVHRVIGPGVVKGVQGGAQA